MQVLVPLVALLLILQTVLLSILKWQQMVLLTLLQQDLHNLELQVQLNLPLLIHNQTISITE
ncbi:MAG: hypothetical protein CMH03_10635 [Marinovum sp.]|nr:hypothetical protein [Marinovum sp.]MAJ05132.1 hypothetical protein [Marinovum sp.]